MSYFLDQLISGLSLGCVYALIALGFGMVYGVLKLLNFAHSEVFTAGAFVGYFALLWLLPLFPYSPMLVVLVSMLMASVGAGLLAVLIEMVAYRPIRRKSKVSALLTAIGMSILLQNVGIQLFSAHTRGYPSIPLPLSEKQFALIMLIISFLFLYYLVYHTHTGLKMRAVSENLDVAELMGINPNRVILLAFFLGGVFAGVGGLIWGLVYGVVHPQMGFYPGLKAFIISVVGSVGQLGGTFFMGVALGVLESLVAAYVPPELSAYKDSIAFVLLIAILIVKPMGVFANPQQRNT